MPVAEAELGEQLVVPAQERVDADRGLGRELRPDQAGALGDRQLDQTEAAGVDRTEVVTAQDADQLALLIVRPRVVRAAEAAGRAVALLDDDRRPVAADVVEPAHDAVVAAREQERHAHHFHRSVVARVPHLGGQRHHQRQTPEHPFDLALPPAPLVVVRGRDPEDVGLLGRGVRLDVGDVRPGHGDDLVAR